MVDGPVAGAKRVSSVAGILGIIKLRLGTRLARYILAWIRSMLTHQRR